MGVSPSNLKSSRGDDTMPSPSMAYGRLRIHESPRVSSSSSSSQRAVTNTTTTTTTASSSASTMKRSHSANTLLGKQVQSQQTDGLIVLESTPLLLSSTTNKQQQQQQDLEHAHNMYGGTNSSNSDGTSQDKNPLLGAWLTPALLCGLSYALYNIFIKLGSYSIHPVLGGVILQIVAALLGTVLIIRAVYFGNNGDEDGEGGKDKDSTHTTTTTTTTTLEYDSNGIMWSVCAGIAVGLAEMLSFFVSSMGVQAVQSIPVIIGGSVMFGTLLGWILLKENLSTRGWFGVLLLVGGICLVGTDPAAATTTTTTTTTNAS